MFGCVFCLEERKTIEEHDATVFFSIAQLFRHLAKHPRPLPKVPGFNVLYGAQTAVDFDLCFMVTEPVLSSFGMKEIAAEVATCPAATAISVNYPKSFISKDPDEGTQHLHFALGARVLGVTFPDRLNGQYCIGYHDGERGCFPASAVTLELPAKEDVLMNIQSNLVAIAKWDFKPKDVKEGKWLKFSKGEKISAVAFTLQEQWCWSGQNSKGKWGLFPSVFVTDLQQAEATTAKLESSLGTVKSGGRKFGSFGSRLGSMGKKKSTLEMRSTVDKKKSGGHIRSGSAGSVNNLAAAGPGVDITQPTFPSPGNRNSKA